MAVPQNFRTAMRGFNREDVVHYLEYLNAKHQNEINQLGADNDTLRGLLEAQKVENRPEEKTALQAQCLTLQAQLEEAEAESQEREARCAELEAQVAELETRCAELEARCAQLDSRETATPAPAAPQQPELDSYRRAQNIEQESRMRAELVYYQTNGVLTEASAKVETVAGEITQLADQAMQELTRLQVAVSESKHALQEAAAMMKSIRPNS